VHIDELIKKSWAGDVLSGEELVYLLSLAPDSVETYMLMAEATRKNMGVRPTQLTAYVFLSKCPNHALHPMNG